MCLWLFSQLIIRLVLIDYLHIFFTVKTYITFNVMQSQDQSEKNNLLRVIFFIAILNLIIFLITQAFFSYGIFRDELYYLACANRIQFGYVDHPPLSIFLLSGWKSLFGDAMFVIRIVPAIITSVTLFMIGLFTMRLGGGKADHWTTDREGSRPRRTPGRCRTVLRTHPSRRSCR